MTSQALPIGLDPTSTKRIGVWLGVIAAAWVAVIATLAAQGVFDAPTEEPILATLAALVVPIAAFVAAMILLPRLRAAALKLDPVLLTEFQAWRIVGALFLALYAFGHLPGLFAWPAGLGDIAVGLAAPFAAWKLRQNPGFLTSVRYRLFHYLGLTDFAVAVVIGAAARNQIAGLVDQITTAPMGVLPLVLIPTLVVPAFIILHLIVLMQIAANRR
jgi:hypothetical protein